MLRLLFSRSIALIAAVLFSGLVPPLAAAADWNGTDFNPAFSRRPLDGSYRYGPMNWTGLYAGGNIGWGGGGSDIGGATDQSVDTDGLIGGVHAGYNFQYQSVVAGLEADLDWSTLEGEEAAGGRTFVANADWLSSLRLRLGYAFNTLLIYGTGGIAVAGYDLSITGPGADADLKETMTGYAVGLGAEYAFTRSVIGRVEALHYGFGEEDFSIGGSAAKTDLDVTTVRAGLTLKLN
jgi:outer membrane immunogenic protein